MERDAFSGCYPAVNFLFFLGAIGFGATIQHPAYCAVGLAVHAVGLTPVTVRNTLAKCE